LQHEIENRLKSEKKIKRAISEVCMCSGVVRLFDLVQECSFFLAVLQQASVQTGSLRTLKGDLRSVSGFLGVCKNSTELCACSFQLCKPM
jgi:hypothetical protein